MAVTELKLKLGALIRVHLKRAGLRQLDFAEAMHVSASAVSQMLSGRMVPSLAQLEIICQKLALDRNQSAELRDCLTRIRTGEAHISSSLNEFLKSSRIERGLSVRQLSTLTGIPVKDLTTLETKVGVRPSPTEAVRLAAALECDIGELWQTPQQPYQAAGGMELREQGVYLTKITKNAPLIRLDSLASFDPQNDTPQEFAWRHLIGVRNVAEPELLLVHAPGPVLGWPELYELELAVAPEMVPAAGMAALTATPDGVALGEIGSDLSTLLLRDGSRLEHPAWFWPVKSMMVRLDNHASGGAEHINHDTGGSV